MIFDTTTGWSRLRALACLMLAIGLSMSGVRPVLAQTTQAEIELPSTRSMQKRDKKAHEEMMAKGAAYDDEKLQGYVTRLGEQLVAQSEMAGMKFTKSLTSKLCADPDTAMMIRYTISDTSCLRSFGFGERVYINLSFLG